MGWVAGKRQRVKRDGGYVWVNPGDPLPEAEHWPNRKSWERQGFIRYLRGGEEAPPEPATVSVQKANSLSPSRATPPDQPSETREGAPAPAGRQTDQEPPEGAQEEPGDDRADGGEKPTTEPAGAAGEAPKGRGRCKTCGRFYKKLELHRCKG